MTRRRHSNPSAHAHKGGGWLVGMRSGVRNIAGVGKSEAPSRRSKLLWNIVTVILVLVTGVVLLRRFGVLHF